jgi:hypothetical protein
MMSSWEIMTNDGSRNGGEDERKMEPVAVKLDWEPLVALGSNGLVISIIEERSG